MKHDSRSQPTPSELEILHVLWSRGPSTVREIHEVLSGQKELGYTSCVLETGTKQHEAIAMYTRLGYERTPPFGPYADLPASVCMRKALR